MLLMPLCFKALASSAEIDADTSCSVCCRFSAVTTTNSMPLACDVPSVSASAAVHNPDEHRATRRIALNTLALLICACPLQPAPLDAVMSFNKLVHVGSVAHDSTLSASCMIDTITWSVREARRIIETMFRISWLLPGRHTDCAEQTITGVLGTLIAVTAKRARAIGRHEKKPNISRKSRFLECKLSLKENPSELSLFVNPGLNCAS